MVERKGHVLFVEGGGDKNPALASECRRAFSQLMERAHVKKRPRVVACGGRVEAYKSFCNELERGEQEPLLLVDAEDVVAAGPPFDPWAHVSARRGDGWGCPDGATSEHLHFMAVSMETWLVADHDALDRVVGRRFDSTKLPAEGSSLESLSKPTINDALDRAAKATALGRYNKGSHSFQTLALVSTAKIEELSWARRFLDAMRALR